MENKKKSQKPKLAYEEFLNKVRNYLDKQGKEGYKFVCEYEKWLDIYFTNHANSSYEDLIKDIAFKLHAGLTTIEELEERRKAAAERRKASAERKKEGKA